MKAPQLALLLFGLSAIFIIAPTPALAKDRLVMKSGAVLTGEIVRESASVLVIAIPGLGQVRVAREDVRTVENEITEGPEFRWGGSTRPSTDDGESSAFAKASIPWEALAADQTVLLLLKGEETEWSITTGTRAICRIAMASEHRLKVVVDPDAGALGHLWVPRTSLDRAIEIEGHPERRILFLDGVAEGAWIQGVKADGSAFAGRVQSLGENGSLILAVPGQEGVAEDIVFLSDVRSLEGLVRKPALATLFRSLVVGEPVQFTVAGETKPRTGMFGGFDGDYLKLESAVGPEGAHVPARVYRGYPFLDLKVLPETLREQYSGAKCGDALTVRTMVEENGRVIRRAVTGRIVHAGLDSIVLEAGGAHKSVALETAQAFERPTEDEAPRLIDGLETSTAPSLFTALPGMTREDAEPKIPADLEGVDVLYSAEDGLVEKIYCRAPFTGPIFGLHIGKSLASGMKVTDLVFDTQIDPQDEGITEMLSHTIRGATVKIYLTDDGKILALELGRR